MFFFMQPSFGPCVLLHEYQHVESLQIEDLQAEIFQLPSRPRGLHSTLPLGENLLARGRRLNVVTVARWAVELDALLDPT